MSDLISRQAAIDELIAFKEAHKADRFTGDFLHWTGIKAMIENLPSAQPMTLTEDDKETIRIHLSAFKESLCNQRRWNEAKEYEELITRLLSTPSVQPRKGKISYTKFCEELWGQSSICSLCGCSWQIAEDGNDNFCPNCGCRMEEGDSNDN